MFDFLKRTKLTRIQVIQRESSELRLAEWRSDPNLTKSASKVIDTLEFKLMFDVLCNEHPGMCVMLTGDVDTRAAQQARAEGYTMALANLKSMSVHQKPMQQLGEPTFGIDEKE